MPEAYLRRVATPHQRHSAAWKDVDLHELSGQAFKNAATQIFADSIAVSGSNELVGALNLRVHRPRRSALRPSNLSGEEIRCPRCKCLWESASCPAPL